MSIPAPEPRKKWSGKKWFALVMMVVWGGLYLTFGALSFAQEDAGEPFLSSVALALMCLGFAALNSRRFHKA